MLILCEAERKHVFFYVYYLTRKRALCPTKRKRECDQSLTWIVKSFSNGCLLAWHSFSFKVHYRTLITADLLLAVWVKNHLLSALLKARTLHDTGCRAAWDTSIFYCLRLFDHLIAMSHLIQLETSVSFYIERALFQNLFNGSSVCGLHRQLHSKGAFWMHWNCISLMIWNAVCGHQQKNAPYIRAQDTQLTASKQYTLCTLTNITTNNKCKYWVKYLC